MKDLISVCLALLTISNGIVDTKHIIYTTEILKGFTETEYVFGYYVGFDNQESIEVTKADKELIEKTMRQEQ